MSTASELTVGQLSRRGFVDASRARTEWIALQEQHPSLSESLLDQLGDTADPDAALTGLSRVLRAESTTEQLIEQVFTNPACTGRVLAVLGASSALTDHLVRRPEDCVLLADERLTTTRPTANALRIELLRAVGADPAADRPSAATADATSQDALRVAYRRALLKVAARDLTTAPDVMDTAGELADLAAAALDAALAIARTEIGAEAHTVRLAIIGMGKCGGRELNYVSDVDVIYVVEPVEGVDEQEATRIGDRLAAATARACSTVTAEGALWEVDAALRPEGKAGALTRTLASHVTYYQRWAKTWEFQALLKARAAAGDLALAAAYLQAVGPMVWEAAGREGFVDDVQQMRRRVEAQLSAGEVRRELKLGPGGLRDIEFAVQLLQLVHGRSDPSLRSGNTMEALTALSAGGYVGRDDAASLGDAYRFLRLLEHRLQLRRLRRTHLMPDDAAELRTLGRSVGFTTDPVEELTTAWRQHSIEARRLHEKLFYRPLLRAVARLDAGESRLSPEAAESRIEALGYRDPKGALRHIEALTAGVSRRAAIQRTLLPVMLGWFADAPDPDAGLLGFRRVSEALGATHWYLALLRDAGATAERLARVLASSRFATDLLLRAPDAVALLADDDALRPRTVDELLGEMQATSGRSKSMEGAATAARAIRRRELFRISAAEVLGALGPEQSGPALTAVAEAALRTMTDLVTSSLVDDEEPPSRFAVIGMGRFGGRELGLGSDLDVLFVHDPLPGADDESAARFATSVATELGRLLTAPTAEPPMQLDSDLRPEGRSGPLTRTLASYEAYYQRWSLTWESQALLRAAPVAGDERLGAQFIELIDRLRWPPVGLTDAQVTEIRRIKARVEAERLPRGADPAFHTKLGPGGLADVEWTVQLVQMQHASRIAALRTTSTLDALAAAQNEGLINPDDAETLRAAWLLATRIRDAIMVAKGRPSDSLPRDSAELKLVAGVMGYQPGRSGDLVEEYRRVSRRARTAVEKVFYE
ncbi:MAG TPA: bifunctional [glutamine synthetase] adenylyltransferase/[glutamine synthetase]-adenylyl-L-tyrosine phosphorylase [Actinomycetes bacterium]|nr:bifunctional [glutamine synthetase] adenylyltransferase/[glutamine synthetase]-adenylyl-L-tyrosine phosphorylase [Actinomycetes bacterium]